MTDRLIQSFRDLADMIVDAAPKVAIGLVLLIVAVIVAKVVEKVLRIVLTRIRFDGLIARVGVDKALHQIGIRQQLNNLLPRLVYFLLLLLFAKTGADAMGLLAISSALGSLFAYLPNIIAALMLIVIGGTAGQFVGQTVAQVAKDSGIEFAASLGRVVSGVIIFIVGIMAMTQLKVDTEIIRLVTTLLLAGMALAFGLSFGLGSRDLTRNIMAGFYARRILEPGRQVEFGGESGVLTAITSTHTLIEGPNGTISVANSVFLEQVTRQIAERPSS